MKTKLLSGDAASLEMPRRRLLAWLLAGTLAPVRSLFGQIRVCPACGTEVVDLETKCRHCGADLPLPREAEPAPAEPEPVVVAERQPPTLPNGVGKPDYDQARRLMEEGDLWSAMLWARNASALMAIEPGLATVRAKLDADRMAMRLRVAMTDRTCPTCDGRRVRRIQVTSLSGKVIEQDVPGAPCPVCHGLGTLPGRMSVAERNAVLGEARTNFELHQRGMGREEWMGIWLPAGSWEALPIRQAAALRRGFGVDCSACSGWGRTACSPCGGTGKTACTNAACIQGTEICPDCKGIGRTSAQSGSRTMTQTCGTCNGAGKRTCTVCAGEGFLVCAQCEGRGETLCTRCNGTGQAPTCTKCGGTGLLNCPSCNGTGKQGDEPCSACKGEGVMLCRTCGGAGRPGR